MLINAKQKWWAEGDRTGSPKINNMCYCKTSKNYGTAQINITTPAGMWITNWFRNHQVCTDPVCSLKSDILHNPVSLSHYQYYRQLGLHTCTTVAMCVFVKAQELHVKRLHTVSVIQFNPLDVFPFYCSMKENKVNIIWHFFPIIYNKNL